MASSGNKKTTMAKLNRERKLRERRVEKQARKDARKHAATEPQGDAGDVLSADADHSDADHSDADQSIPAGAAQNGAGSVVPSLGDA